MRTVLRTLRRASPLLLAGVTAAACASGGDHAALGPVALTSTEQFPIEVRERPAEIRLRAHPEGLSPAQEQALGEVAVRWRSQGGGAVTIHAPTVGGRPAALATAESSRGLLVSLGVAPELVRIAAFEAPPDAPAVVTVAYASFEAIGPVCGQNWENLSSTGQNEAWANYGCAVTANIAAQVANPRDFLLPQREGPADATRRSVVLDKYRKGEVISSAADQKAKGAVSDSVRD